MIGLMLAAALGAQAAPQAGLQGDEWVVIDVQHVIAPEQLRGQCFVQGRVREVVRGRAYRPGEEVALSLACTADRQSFMIPLKSSPGVVERPPISVRRLESLKRALVHIDRRGRVIGNEYYAIGPEGLAPGRSDDLSPR